MGNTFCGSCCVRVFRDAFCPRGYGRRTSFSKGGEPPTRWTEAEKYVRKVSETTATGDVLDCWFFPENAGLLGGKNKLGTGSIQRASNREAFLERLRSTKKWIDIAVFTITDNSVARILKELFARSGSQKVHIRIVTDDQQAASLGSDVYELAGLGIPVIHDNDTSAHMHHKFAVIDGEYVLTGSYNWSRAAFTRNRENMILSNDVRMIRAFMAEFERLWSTFRHNRFFAPPDRVAPASEPQQPAFKPDVKDGPSAMTMGDFLPSTQQQGERTRSRSVEPSSTASRRSSGGYGWSSNKGGNGGRSKSSNAAAGGGNGKNTRKLLNNYNKSSTEGKGGTPISKDDKGRGKPSDRGDREASGEYVAVTVVGGSGS
ncbi:unnamed protein product [Amoebophrya sp. A25]|nr:unnamed protein product [Amoebophrya sp. A25]|eukprot:GSA25T00016883001.1